MHCLSAAVATRSSIPGREGERHSTSTPTNTPSARSTSATAKSFTWLTDPTKGAGKAGAPRSVERIGVELAKVGFAQVSAREIWSIAPARANRPATHLERRFGGSSRACRASSGWQRPRATVSSSLRGLGIESRRPCWVDSERLDSWYRTGCPLKVVTVCKRPGAKLTAKNRVDTMPTSGRGRNLRYSCLRLFFGRVCYTIPFVRVADDRWSVIHGLVQRSRLSVWKPTRGRRDWAER